MYVIVNNYALPSQMMTHRAFALMEAPPVQLTEQELNYFHTFGFLHVPKLFSVAEIAWITASLSKYSRPTGIVRITMVQHAP